MKIQSGINHHVLQKGGVMLKENEMGLLHIPSELAAFTSNV